ncbi:MAG: alpha/beta hydrolase [Bacteroidia bacterium]|nr:alpha/beta hydrolase [Bacteroidia bacterium]
MKKLTAPKKEIVWFENSGHEPLEEEPKEFNQAIIDRIVK